MAPVTTSVTTKWPTAQSVKPGATVSVSGTVTGGPGGPSPSSTESRTRAGETLASTTTSGAYSLQIPTSWYTVHSLRIYVPALGTYAAVAAAEGKTLTVTTPYKPLGKATHYDLTGYRFDPCQPTVTYRVNPDRMPKGALTDIKKAAWMITAATGIRLTYDGRTNVIPWNGYAKGGRNYEPPALSGFDLALGWATPAEVPLLKGGVTGLGGATETTWNGDVNGLAKTNAAQVVFDSTYNKHTPKGFGKGYTRGYLILHEMGHALGLDHAFEPYQMMGYSSNTLTVARFGAGDLVGLRNVGRSAGCWVGVEEGLRAARQEPRTPTPLPVFASRP